MVLGWLRKRRDPSPSGKLNKAAIKALDTWLSKLDAIDPKLRRPCLAFLLDGSKDAVLLELAAEPRCANELGIKIVGTGAYRRRQHEGLFLAISSDDNIDPAIIWRTGLLCAACATNAQILGGDSDLPLWIRAVVLEGSSVQPGTWRGRERSTLTAGLLSEAMVLAAVDTSELAAHVIALPIQNSYEREALRSIPNLGALLAEHPATVNRILPTLNAKDQVQSLETLIALDADSAPFAESLTALACGSRKKARDLISRLVQDWQALVPHLRQTAIEGKPTERLAAIQHLGSHDPDAAPFFVERLTQEQAPSVVEAMHAWQHRDQEAETDEPLVIEALQTPARPPLATPATPKADLVDLLRHTITPIHDAHVRDHRRYRDHAWRKLELRGPMDDRSLGQFADAILNPEPWDRVPINICQHYTQYYQSVDTAALAQNCDELNLSLLERIRVAIIIGLLHPGARRNFQFSEECEALVETCQRSDGTPIDLRDIDEAVSRCAQHEWALVRSILSPDYSYQPLPFGTWDHERFWPLFAEQVDLLEMALGARKDEHFKPEYDFQIVSLREKTFTVLSRFPQLPPQLRNAVWADALGSHKTKRRLAQPCLNGEPDTDQRLIEALGDGKQDVRAEAASWLGDRRCTDAVPALIQALKKEKRDVAKAAMLMALEQLGESIDAFLDRSNLLKEAQHGLKKGAPADCGWLEHWIPPLVHWDDGAPIEAEVIRWWVIKACRLKQPAPDPLLVRYGELMKPADARTLAEVVLDSWIAQDTRSRREVTPQQDQLLQQQAQAWARWSGDSVQQCYDKLRHQFLTEPLGSAIKSKGVLALAGAMGGPELVPTIEHYLKTWYGRRVHQCKALLSVLAWSKDLLATQLLLSVAGRFRTAGIRKEAEKLVNELADRQGWTIDELADRTAPNAGFDHQGLMELTYLRQAADGEEATETARCIEVRLDDQLAISITNDAGKVVKSLPAARADEDEASVKAAKKQFSQAKKSLKQILKQQSLRFYEAMCAQRMWTISDWRMFILEHPILGRLARRLVWIIQRDDTIIPFRPLADGSLCDHEDEEMQLADGDRIGVAHSTMLSPDTVTAWSEHQADYEIEPLFDQFVAAPFQLDGSQQRASQLNQWKGHRIKAFKLRSLATKQGFVRSAAEDGGWFHSYHKHFPNLGIDVELSFTGNSLPEEDRDSALISLEFFRATDTNSYHRQHIRLGDVPAVLLAESAHQMASFAAAGTGYDPDWEQY